MIDWYNQPTHIITENSSETIMCSMGKWKGKDILVTDQNDKCPVEGHALEVMHHFDDDGKHYCPTGLLMCPYCGGIADEPQPYSCLKWGEK